MKRAAMILMSTGICIALNLAPAHSADDAFSIRLNGMLQQVSEHPAVGAKPIPVALRSSPGDIVHPVYDNDTGAYLGCMVLRDASRITVDKTTSLADCRRAAPAAASPTPPAAPWVPPSFPTAAPPSHQYRGLSEGCFGAGTLVDTPSGSKPVEELRTGDQVLAFDDATGRIVSSTVESPRRIEAVRVGILTLEDGTRITVTPSHPFYDPASKTYRPLAELGEKAALTCRAGYCSKRSYEMTNEFRNVYTFEVKTFHNYFVFGVLVHNKPTP